jgi:hypothetical protein
MAASKSNEPYLLKLGLKGAGPLLFRNRYCSIDLNVELLEA